MPHFVRSATLPGLLVLVCVGIWCGLTHRWSPGAWMQVDAYTFDVLEVYARIKAASEDLRQPVMGYGDIERLGAPFGADWSGYPVSDWPLFVIAGLLARVSDPYLAFNVMQCLAHVAAALAFYWCGRRLGWREEWAFVLALLFAFCHFNLSWGGTLSLNYTFTIPPVLLLCGWIAGRGKGRDRFVRWAAPAALAGIAAGSGNLYFAFLILQLTAFVLLFQWLRRRDIARLRIGAIFAASLALGLGVQLLPYGLHLIGDDKVSGALERNYAGSEIYGLKLMDLWIPPDRHRFGGFSAMGSRYKAESALQGEFFGNYMGIVGLAGLVGLLAAPFWRMAQGKDIRFPDATAAAFWVLLFAVAGGFNSLLAFAGVDVFRASNRYSIFLLGWALFWLGSRLQRLSAGRPRAYSVVAAVALGVFGLWDQAPSLGASSSRSSVVDHIAGDRAFWREVGTELGAGARVFQLPAAPFPEAGAIHGMSDYEHFRGFLASDNLRFSYGALRGTHQARWNAGVGRLPPIELVKELEKSGFSALWVDGRGLSSDRRERVGQLKEIGIRTIPYPHDPNLALVRLNPRVIASMPNPRDPRWLDSWDADMVEDGEVRILTAGWYPLEKEDGRKWRWAGREARTTLWSPHRRGRARITCSVFSLVPGELEVRHGNRSIWKGRVGPEPLRDRVIELDLDSEFTELEWRFSGRPRRPSGGDRRKLGFGVENPEVRFF